MSNEIRRTGSEDQCFDSYAAGDHDSPPEREEQCELSLHDCLGDATILLRDDEETVLSCLSCARRWVQHERDTVRESSR